MKEDNTKQTPRPVRHLHAAGRLYPNAWKQVDLFRKDRGKDLPEWPEWCFLPLAAWYAIVSEGGVMPPDRVPDVGRLGAVGTWRYSQGIYRFHPETLKALSKTSLDGEIPAEVLLRLPEWCVYIETPDLSCSGYNLFGFFAHLEWDVNTGRRELRLVLDTESELLPMPLHLGGNIIDVVNKALIETHVQGTLAGATLPVPSQKVVTDLAAEIAPLVSLLLYLCADEPEIEDRRHPGYRPQRPQPTRVKGGWRLFPAQSPRTWLVGENIGRAISASRENLGPGEETGRSVKPHLRRAHWHGFWSGPKKGDRQFRYKWLPPIPVNPESTR